IVVTTEEGSETCIGIETRPAQPVDGAVPPHQCRGHAVANQPIIFDLSGHFVISGRTETPSNEAPRCIVMLYNDRQEVFVPVGDSFVGIDVPIYAAYACCKQHEELKMAEANA